MLGEGAVAAVVGGLAAFVVVAGWALLRWAATGRDPRYLDDASILVAAPPPGMTAATATVIDGGGPRLALLAGLLDLASRDEIAFRAEQAPDAATTRVGIEIRGGPTDDPRVLLNRRLPIGEAEAWLLTFLKEFGIQASSGVPSGLRASEGLEAMLRFMGFTSGGAGDGPGDTLAAGMLAATPDIGALVAAAEARSGHPISDRQRATFEKFAPLLEMMRNPAAVAADPQAWAERVAAVTGHPPTAQEVEQIREWAAHRTAPAAVGTPGSTSLQPATYISASDALRLRTPIGFGTFLETYARRHGWLAGLSLVARLKWRALAVVEVIVGLVVASFGGSQAGLLTGVGLGAAGGGVITWLIAPSMAARTPAGAITRAQLAAYRRTLQATFTTAPTLDAAVTAAGLAWLETPDQVLVWGVALGLQTGIETILDRAAGPSAGLTTRQPYLPAWWHPGPTPTTGAAAMFAGIEAIGSLPVELRTA
jgi:hypothetical protein